MNSGGSYPPVLSAIFLIMTAKLSGEICFAASILMPEMPTEISSVM